MHADRAYRHILVETDGGIAQVTMNRPEKRNALSVAHMEELIDALRGVARRPDVGVVVLRGNGPAFCAGHDLAELVGRDAAFYRHVFEVCTVLMETVQQVPQPVIAQVHGVATAAGCQLVATCDLAVASERAQFATPGVKIGLFCSTPMVALTRVVGRKKALEMLLTGEPLSAHEALQLGLVNRVVPHDALQAETLAVARRVLAASPRVVGLGKQAFYRQIEMPQSQAYAYAKEVMTLNALAPDAQEGICAFLEKRPPHWPARDAERQERP
ncbi:MAG TPA: enoyl-CoA hydratase [Chloroflexota bacterium]